MNQLSLRCPVCNHFTFAAPDNKQQCHDCGWINDARQLESPDWPDGENGISLNKYKKKYLEWMMI